MHPPRSVLLLATGLLAVVLAACNAGGSRVERGATLYDASCRNCHGGASGGTVRDIPPPHNASGHTWHHQECLLKEIVRNGFVDPDAPEGKPTMPAFKDQLTDEEVAAILAHMKTWWTDEQRQWQREVTQQACS